MVRLRAEPEDFVVDELPLYPPSGEGDHTFVHVKKRLRNTEEVARALARFAGVRPRDVGYAGRKDRAAVTTQWFSVPDLDPEAAHKFDMAGVYVLGARSHGHKLRTGQLAGNRFRIRVREADPAAVVAARARLASFVVRGMPNRFGGQRFGRDGDNAIRARALLGQTGEGRPAPRERREARFLLSALQSAVFNEVLALRERGEPAAIDRVVDGDVARLHTSGGLFLVEDAAAEAARADAFEISATGPMFGTRPFPAGGAAAELEARVLSAWGLSQENLELPRGMRLRGGRRPFRVQPAAALVASSGDGATLHFELPPGSYASVLVEELFGDVVEGPAEVD